MAWDGKTFNSGFNKHTNVKWDRSESCARVTAAHLDGVVVGLAGFRVGFVGHEPRLQQVLVEAVAQSSERGVICGEMSSEISWRRRE